MPAYFVAVRTEPVKDQARFDHYVTNSRPAMAGHDCKPLAIYGRLRSTDGPITDGALIMEFPTFEAAEAWYDSPAYQAAVVDRFASAEYRTFIIEGR
jgi:uncharacterized protein (DUF1330 family)